MCSACDRFTSKILALSELFSDAKFIEARSLCVLLHHEEHEGHEEGDMGRDEMKSIPEYASQNSFLQEHKNDSHLQSRADRRKAEF